EEEESGFLETVKEVGEGALNVAKSTADFLILDDINTLRDSESSTVAKVIAGASLFPAGKLLKLRKADDLFKVNSKGEIPAKKVDGGSGEVDKPIANKLPRSTYNERLSQTPINNGKWTGRRGESTFISDDENVKRILKEVDKKGIIYSDAIPDFSIVSKGQVQVPNMKVDRRINFREADNLLAKE